MRLIPRTVLIAALVLAAGCGTGGGDPTPTPSTPAVVNPTPTPTPTPTSSEDALYAEAERVYLAALETQWKFELAGDYSEFPSELADYYSPDYYELLRTDFENFKAQGLRVTGTPPTVSVAPAPEQQKDGADAVLESCYDARGLVTLNEHGQEINRGQLIHGFIYLAYMDTKLKIQSTTLEQVETCSIG